MCTTRTKVVGKDNYMHLCMSLAGNLMISLGQYSISLRKRHINRGMDIQTVLLTLASLHVFSTTSKSVLLPDLEGSGDF